MMNLVSKLHASREEGQTMAEYAVVLGVITIAVVVTARLPVRRDPGRPAGRHRHPAHLITSGVGEPCSRLPHCLTRGGLTCRPTSESGQTMAEYAVTLTVITAGIMLTLGLVAGNISTLIGGITTSSRASCSRAGQSIVEFTLVLLPLLLILFGIIELGLVMFDKVTVVHDAREAARLAAVNDASGKTLLADAPAGSTLTFTCADRPDSGNAAGRVQRRRQDHRPRHLRRTRSSRRSSATSSAARSTSRRTRR